jgi:hypothetical protein
MQCASHTVPKKSCYMAEYLQKNWTWENCCVTEVLISVTLSRLWQCTILCPKLTESFESLVKPGMMMIIGVSSEAAL